MPYLVTQTLASIADPDVVGVAAVEPNVPVHEFLAFEHEPLELGVVPEFFVAGTPVTLGARGTDSAYTYVRVSPTQTVIRRTVYPIGSGVIGQSFMVS